MDWAMSDSELEGILAAASPDADLAAPDEFEGAQAHNVLHDVDGLEAFDDRDLFIELDIAAPPHALYRVAAEPEPPEPVAVAAPLAAFQHGNHPFTPAALPHLNGILAAHALEGDVSPRQLGVRLADMFINTAAAAAGLPALEADGDVDPAGDVDEPVPAPRFRASEIRFVVVNARMRGFIGRNAPRNTRWIVRMFNKKGLYHVRIGPLTEWRDGRLRLSPIGLWCGLDEAQVERYDGAYLGKWGFTARHFFERFRELKSYFRNRDFPMECYDLYFMHCICGFNHDARDLLAGEQELRNLLSREENVRLRFFYTGEDPAHLPTGFRTIRSEIYELTCILDPHRLQQVASMCAAKLQAFREAHPLSREEIANRLAELDVMAAAEFERAEAEHEQAQMDDED